MIDYTFTMKLVAWLTMNTNVNETQIRNFLSDYQTNVTARLTTLVANAPPVAQAVLNDVGYKLKVTTFDPGSWEIYPKVIMDLTVADGITMNQVRLYLEDFWDQAKADLRTLVANTPPGANVQITEWHVHRLSGSTDEIE